MRRYFQITVFVLVFQLAGCSGSEKFLSENQRKTPHMTIEGGINKGGVVENTDMGVVGNASVDAYSGATNTGFHTGLYTQIPFLKNRLETGIGYMYNKQIFTYNDFANTFIGEREIGASQFMLPISYNFGFFKNQFEGGLFRLKLGFMFQYNLLDIEDHSNELPGYKINDFSNGLLLGFETIPFQLNNGNRLGLTLEMYRGSQVYDDYYNREDFEMPGSSFFKAGIIYQLNFK